MNLALICWAKALSLFRLYSKPECVPLTIFAVALLCGCRKTKMKMKIVSWRICVINAATEDTHNTHMSNFRMPNNLIFRYCGTSIRILVPEFSSAFHFFLAFVTRFFVVVACIFFLISSSSFAISQTKYQFHFANKPNAQTCWCQHKIAIENRDEQTPKRLYRCSSF